MGWQHKMVFGIPSSKNTNIFDSSRHWHWFGENLRAHHSKKELLEREEVYGSWMAGAAIPGSVCRLLIMNHNSKGMSLLTSMFLMSQSILDILSKFK